MLTSEQSDMLIKCKLDAMEAESEYRNYIADLELKKMKFKIDHPDIDENVLNVIFMPVMCKRQTIQIKFI